MVTLLRPLVVNIMEGWPYIAYGGCVPPSDSKLMPFMWGFRVSRWAHPHQEPRWPNSKECMISERSYFSITGIFRRKTSGGKYHGIVGVGSDPKRIPKGCTFMRCPNIKRGPLTCMPSTYYKEVFLILKCLISHNPLDKIWLQALPLSLIGISRGK